MPKRELKYPEQVEQWLMEWSQLLHKPSEMILIGSGGLLWHAAQANIAESLDENSMDVDPVTDDEELIMLCYDALIGSDFELKHGWHVNIMPREVMNEFLSDWRNRSSQKSYGHLTVIVPSVQDLMVPKLKRNEPRDKIHQEWVKKVGLI